MTELKLSTAAGDITGPAETIVKKVADEVKEIPTVPPKTDANSAAKAAEVLKDAVKPVTTI